jgi:hypothetical protein
MTVACASPRRHGHRQGSRRPLGGTPPRRPALDSCVGLIKPRTAWAGVSKVTAVAKHPNGTPGKKPPAPSIKRRPDRTPPEQRSGAKPAPTVHSETSEVEPGKRPKRAPARRGQG